VTLVLRRAGSWSEHDYDVFDGEREVGRIYRVTNQPDSGRCSRGCRFSSPDAGATGARRRSMRPRRRSGLSMGPGRAAPAGSYRAATLRLVPASRLCARVLAAGCHTVRSLQAPPFGPTSGGASFFEDAQRAGEVPGYSAALRPVLGPTLRVAGCDRGLHTVHIHQGGDAHEYRRAPIA
jgi:hypothetical protein